MNCLKEAEYKLRDYNAKKRSLISTAEQIAMLEAESTCVRSATTDSTPAQGGGICRAEECHGSVSGFFDGDGDIAEMAAEAYQAACEALGLEGTP